jgi:hypothetical protein
MLVRLGLAAADSVPKGQRVVRAAQRAARALPKPRSAAGNNTPHEAAYAYEEPATSFDARRAQQADAAYRAADLVQPRPGLFLHVRA